jgi:hypothetical protein
MHDKKALLAAAAMAFLVLAGCGSYGYPYGHYGSRDIRGTVDYVDPATRSIVLMNGMYSGYGSRDVVRIYYDRNTRVSWNGRDYRPDDLERGDEVDVRASNSNGHLFADTVLVTYNSANGAAPVPSANVPNANVPNGSYSQTIDGTVRSIETSRHQIGIDRGGTTIWVDYDDNTSVVWNGRTYMPRDLEPGDEVSVSTYDIGGRRLRATSVNVIRSVRQ